MGRLLQLLFTKSGGKILSSKMFGLCALLLFTSAAQALPTLGNVQCTLNYNIVHEEKCHHKQVCHEEHEVVVTTTLLRNVRTLSPSIVTMNTRMFITPPMLLAMTVLLLVTRLVTAMATAIMESVRLMLVTPVVLTARSMLRRSVTRSLSKTHTKSHIRSATQSQSVIQLLLKFPTKFVLVSASPSQGQNTEWHSFTEQISLVTD